MAFPWYHSKRLPSMTKSWSDKFDIMYLQGIKEHVLLLKRLGHKYSTAEKNIKAKITWEFESMSTPKVEKRLTESAVKIVKEIYGK